ncbi:hypothetical protein SKAU_G00391910 [Synaphobranchus kaupii]|uniref:Odontogenic ameloblast-associated protein n=1 Tax=Synaphobranchus kaupii TaxID=118154 RepID=A0A9Q1IDP5_SYNKA|nr:hypothetical protein SKAU_G00391910 [Synaphobranchus kaupii]
MIQVPGGTKRGKQPRTSVADEPAKREVMKLLAVITFACVLGACTAIPIYQQFGILASNSNELLRLNGLTFSGVGFGQAQTASFLPPYMIQQGADIGLPFNTQVAGPFLPQNPSIMLPTGGNPLNPVLFPPGQQEQPQGAQGPQGPQDPNAAQQPKVPSQMVPGYYPTMPFGQRPGGQRYPYYYYRYPQGNPNMVLQPTQGFNQMNLEQTTQLPQLPLQVSQTQGQLEAVHVTESRTSAPPPDRHGDTPKTGLEDGRSGFSFLFEP